MAFAMSIKIQCKSLMELRDVIVGDAFAKAIIARIEGGE
jgi:hypothetical protein